jgi:carboxymethylenebutenolidase
MNSSPEMANNEFGFNVYKANAATADAPAILVLHEIFGINENIRRTVDRFAAQGYNAIAPDLFWRQRPGVDLNPDLPESRTEAMALMDGYVKYGAHNLADLQHMVEVLRSKHRKVAVVGYCLGGRMSLMCWLTTAVDAAVVYYGVNMSAAMGDLPMPSSPLLVHLGATDPLNPADAREHLVQRLASAPDARIIVHDAVGHAFARLGAGSYVAEAAEAADHLTFSFLKKTLA